MKPSKPAIVVAMALAVAVVGKWEGKRNTPYKDIVGVQTVCYGETRVKMQSYTDAECTAMLTKALDGFKDEVLKCTPILADRPKQLAAAVSGAYNYGSATYCKSTAAKRFSQKNWKGGCEALTWFNKAGGKTIKGLVNRRKDEYSVCISDL